MDSKEVKAFNDAPLRVIFCDSDSSHVKQYAHVVQQICKIRGVPVKVMYYPKGAHLLADLARNKTDPTILIVEAELSDHKGLGILRKIRGEEVNCQIILLSNTPAYALEGYEVGALAYLIKGATSPELFTNTFTRALDCMIDANQQYITFSCAGYSQTIRLRDILYFEVVRKIVTVHYEGGQFEFYSTLGKIEDMLASYGFVRVHRNYVVSLSKIARHENDTLILDSGAVIPIGRNYRKGIMAALKSLDGLGA